MTTRIVTGILGILEKRLEIILMHLSSYLTMFAASAKLINIDRD